MNPNLYFGPNPTHPLHPLNIQQHDSTTQARTLRPEHHISNLAPPLPTLYSNLPLPQPHPFRQPSAPPPLPPRPPPAISNTTLLDSEYAAAAQYVHEENTSEDQNYELDDDEALATAFTLSISEVDVGGRPVRNGDCNSISRGEEMSDEKQHEEEIQTALALSLSEETRKRQEEEEMEMVVGASLHDMEKEKDNMERRRRRRNRSRKGTHETRQDNKKGSSKEVTIRTHRPKDKRKDAAIKKAIKKIIAEYQHHVARGTGHDEAKSTALSKLSAHTRGIIETSSDGWQGWNLQKVRMEASRWMEENGQGRREERIVSTDAEDGDDEMNQRDAYRDAYTGDWESDEETVRVNPEVCRRSLRRVTGRREVLMSGALLD